MAGKIYFIFITLFILFANRYQYVTSASYGFLDYLFLVRDGLLLFAGFCYFFKKSLLKPVYWNYVWWFLIVQLLLSLLKQILPGSYYGDLQDGQLGANLIAFLVSTAFFIPLYIAAFKLKSFKLTNSKKRKG